MQRTVYLLLNWKNNSFIDSLVSTEHSVGRCSFQGSALNITLNFSVDATGLRRTSGKNVLLLELKLTDKLKVCFTVADIVIAQAGDRTIL